MMQRHFDQELKGLNEEIIKMGALAEESIYKSIDALRTLNADMAQQVIDNDEQIDELELKIEKMAIGLLALRQPLAIDLRFITTAMKLNSELERIADLSVNIAQKVIELSDKPLLKQLVDIPKISEIARRMVKGAIDAFVNRDEALARSVILDDPKADELRTKIYNEIIDEYLCKDGTTAPRAVPLLLISRHLERICDHASYIAQDIIYMIQAKQVRHHIEEL